MGFGKMKVEIGGWGKHWGQVNPNPWPFLGYKHIHKPWGARKMLLCGWSHNLWSNRHLKVGIKRGDTVFWKIRNWAEDKEREECCVPR